MTSAALVAAASQAGLAHAASGDVKTATGTEGASVTEVVVTAERNTASTIAPSKASLLETQPQSIITHQYIEQATPEAGDYTTAILIAPSIAGVSSNGGGVGDTNTSTLRGFQDGQYNITYDGIAFGDANDTTHHPAAFFPSSTIGAAVVDRGPGAAGDLGQANFGGAVHLFSPTVSDTFGASQKVSYGSFNTQSYVTRIQTGAISQLNGAKLYLGLDERSSDGELSYARGEAFNQTAKIVVPITSNLEVTGFTSFNYTRYFQDDNGAGMGMGQTLQQLQAYGKNFQLNNNPFDEHYFGYNQVKKHTDFNYIDLKWNAGGGLTVEDQLYDYYYQNKTVSAQNSNDPVNPTFAPAVSPSSAAVDSGSVAANPTDIGGYHKLNQYQTFGDIFRINQDFGFGTARVGGLVESSWAHRFIYNYDLTTGKPDDGAPGIVTPLASPNTSYDEPSHWFQYQLFADFQYRPTDALTITPGIKYLNYTRYIDAYETLGSDGFAVDGHKTYTKPLYFLTLNYKLTADWSVYAQAASAFLVPPIKTLGKFPNSLNASSLPEQTWTYQAGTVYTAGAVTADFDGYVIRATDVLVSSSACQCFLNAGKGDYSGIETEGAYNFGHGFTAFANGSINVANNPTPGAPTKPFSNAPKGTAAGGLIYRQGPWFGTVSYKLVGPQIGSDGATDIKSYSTTDASISYDFGRFKLKVAGTNLFDNRSLTDFDGAYYVFQVGRQIEGTIEAKF
ncbi:MAG TPA: TonB-dependent receptor [Caulobacteraceae bacterium]|nr:TonB-dependent receptor [Caulobacteraceae bacterium]